MSMLRRSAERDTPLLRRNRQFPNKFHIPAFAFRSPSVYIGRSGPEPGDRPHPTDENSNRSTTMKTRPFVLLSLSLLFSLCPSAFPLDDSGENAALAAAFRKAPDRQNFLTELWVKQPVQEAYGEKLYALFLAQKTLEEKARFLQEFQTAKKWFSVPDPLYIGRQLLCLKTAEALAQNPDSPELRFSLALLLNNNETVVSDTRLGHLGKAPGTCARKSADRPGTRLGPDSDRRLQPGGNTACALSGNRRVCNGTEHACGTPTDQR